MASAIHQLIAQQSGPDVLGSLARGAQVAGMIQQVRDAPAQRELAKLQLEQGQQRLDLGARQLAQVDAEAAAAKQMEGMRFAADMGMALSRMPEANRQAAYMQLKQDWEAQNPMGRPLPDAYGPEVQQVLDFAVQRVYGQQLMDRENKMEMERLKQQGKRQLTPYQEEQLQLQRAQNERLAAQADATRSLAEQNLGLKRQELDLKQTKQEREQLKLANEKAATFNLYQTAMDGLRAGLGETAVGPVAGRIPAITTGQQIAEGAVAALAPVLKQIFRVAGEGTFTDKDQELLLRMVPTRTDSEEAAAAKIENIDRIIRAKMGFPEPVKEGPDELSIDDLVSRYAD